MIESPDPSGLEENQPGKPSFRTLKELIDFASGKNVQDTSSDGDAGFAEALPFPFLALVGQTEMKMALILALINPAIGGVLLIGPRGTGKTTAVRSILDLLPTGLRSTCFYGCLPEDIENGGIDAVCPDCAKKYGEGTPFAIMDRVRLVELPLHSKLEDIIGSLDDRALVHERLRLKRGLLAQADHNILYIDEVNLLSDDIVNAILDAAARGCRALCLGTACVLHQGRTSGWRLVGRNAGSNLAWFVRRHRYWRHLVLDARRIFFLQLDKQQGEELACPFRGFHWICRSVKILCAYLLGRFGACDAISRNPRTQMVVPFDIWCGLRPRR